MNRKLGNLIYSLRLRVRVLKNIGKTNDCKACRKCEKEGCIKNKIAEKFYMAGCIDARCFVPKRYEIEEVWFIDEKVDPYIKFHSDKDEEKR